MESVQQKYGKLKWKDLFKEAEKLAKKGFPLTERTSSQVAGLLARNASCDDRLFFRDPTAFEYFAQNPFDSNGIPVANRVEANKRPRSSMSPTIVFDADGNVEIEEVEEIQKVEQVEQV